MTVKFLEARETVPTVPAVPFARRAAGDCATALAWKIGCDGQDEAGDHSDDAGCGSGGDWRYDPYRLNGRPLPARAVVRPRVRDVLKTAIPWFVVTVPQGRERVVADVLWRVDVLGWVPMLTRYVRTGRHRKARRPQAFVMLPGYVFVAVPKDEHWAAVKCVERWDARQRRPVRLVSGVIAMEGRPSMARPDVMRELWAVTQAERAHRVAAETTPRYRAGETRRVIDGPFAGLPAMVDGDVGAADLTMRVLVEIFGRQTPVVLDVEQVR